MSGQIEISKRISSNSAISKKEGSKVVLAGWIDSIRDIGKLAFIKLRDRDGYIQLIISDKDLLASAKDLSIESCILVEGKVKKSKQKSGDNEIDVETLEVLNKAATPLPIDMSGVANTDLSTRLDNRFLDLRSPQKLAIFKIRADVLRAIREFFRNNNFIEIQTPKIAGAGAEGGATLFVFDYFGKPAYLNQSQQLYKQLMNIAGFEKVFEIGPSFRAEKSHTTRHTTEFTHLDVEMSFIDGPEDIYKTEEKLIVCVLDYIKTNCKDELKLLDVNIEIPKVPFPRISHTEAVKLLQEAGIKIKDGADIGTDNEKKLGEIIKKKYKSDLFFLCKFPWSLDVCKFYWMREENHGRGGDLEYKGEEMATGSQREHRYDVLVKQIKEKGLKPKDFEYYLEPFKFGAPPHGGFGFGVDRFIEKMLDMDNIREVILFPRDPERLTP